MSASDKRMLTPMRRVRGLGSARSGTGHFWQQRISGFWLIALTIAFIVIVIMLLGRNHAAVVQILGSPAVAILMLTFIGTTLYHMWIGMTEIIVDYVHSDLWKIFLLSSNAFFCVTVGVCCVFAIFKLSFGV